MPVKVKKKKQVAKPIPANVVIVPAPAPDITALHWDELASTEERVARLKAVLFEVLTRVNLTSLKILL